MYFIQDLAKGIVGKPDSKDLWENIINSIPSRSLTYNKDRKFLFPAVGNGTEVTVLFTVLKSTGWSKHQILNAFYIVDKYKAFTNPFKRLGFKHVYTADFLEVDILDKKGNIMKFDIIVGNPPFQRKKEFGSHNSSTLYKSFALKSINLLKPCGFISFISPVAILSTFEHFDDNLSTVNYTANNHFSVGVDIVAWGYKKNYHGKTKIKHLDNTVSSSNIICEKSMLIPTSIKKKIKNTPVDKRYFIRDRFADKSRGTGKEFIYPLNGKNGQVEYSKKISKFNKKNKLVMARSKTFIEDNIIINNESFGANYLFVLTDGKKISDIKQYIFSKWFLKLDAFFKKMFNGEFGIIITYMPDPGNIKTSIPNYFNLTKQEIKYIENHVK